MFVTLTHSSFSKHKHFKRHTIVFPFVIAVDNRGFNKHHLAPRQDVPIQTQMPEKNACMFVFSGELFAYKLTRDNREEPELFRIIPFVLNQASKIGKLNSSPKMFYSNYM